MTESAITHLGSQRNNLAPTLHPQICADNTTDTRAKHLTLVVQEDGSIVVKTNETAVWPANGFPGADDDSTTNVSLADLCGRGGCLARDWTGTLDDADDLVADGAPAVVDLLLEDVDALDEEGP